MLEEVKRSYVLRANSIVPNWKDLDVNTLCNLYIEHENNESERDGYFSAIMLKKWGYIGRHYTNSKASGFSIEQCYDMVCDAVLYILKMRKWLDPNNKLYGDKSGPDKCLNRCIFSARQRDYYLSNRDKRKINFGNVSLDTIIENVGDHSEILEDEDFSSEEDLQQSIFSKSLVVQMFNKNKIIEALILDNILNDDCFVTKVKTEEMIIDDEVEEYKTYQNNFKLGKLVNNLYNYDADIIREICYTYSIKEDVVLDILPILNRDKGKLSRIVKATLAKMSQDKELRESLCC